LIPTIAYKSKVMAVDIWYVYGRDDGFERPKTLRRDTPTYTGNKHQRTDRQIETDQ